MDERVKKTTERMRLRRQELGLSYQDLSRLTGYSKSVLQRYETGAIEKLPLTRLEVIARAMTVTPEWLMGWEGETDQPEPDRGLVAFPVVGSIGAGYDEVANEEWTGETVEFPRRCLRGRLPGDFFVLTVHGDSMYPLYLNGDKVLILKQATLNRSGEVGAILYDGDQATLKKVEYVKGEDWMKLIPLNPTYPPKLIEGAELERCRVLGLPWALLREIEA